jgi:hypothetical protein
LIAKYTFYYIGCGLNNPGFESLKEQAIFFFFQNIQNGSVAGYVVAVLRGAKRLGLRLTTHLHLVPRLRITGASVPLAPIISATLFHN